MAPRYFNLYHDFNQFLPLDIQVVPGGFSTSIKDTAIIILICSSKCFPKRSECLIQWIWAFKVFDTGSCLLIYLHSSCMWKCMFLTCVFFSNGCFLAMARYTGSSQSMFLHPHPHLHLPVFSLKINKHPQARI